VSDPVERLQSALAREALRAQGDLERLLLQLARVHVRRLTSGATAKIGRLVEDLSQAISRLKAAADLGGRVDMRFRRAPIEPEAFESRPEDSTVPAVAFEEAITDLATRDPVGALELQRMGRDVEYLYNGVIAPDGSVFYPHGFSAARALEQEVAKRVRDALLAGQIQGTPAEEVAQELVEDWGWPASYARNVARTNYATAATAGRFVAAERVQEAGFAVGFRYSATKDSNVRRGRPQDNGENHLALDGLTARADDPVWRKFSPPGGHSCRCVLLPIVGDEVPSYFVQAPAAAAFAPGFGSRPDLR
jgi:SPP1 gp7 family putative phage head morphogenesis protein